eukprot:s2841_g12.t2
MGFAPQRRLRCPDLVLHGQGTFTGNTVEISLVDSSVVLKGLPGPCPNDAMLPAVGRFCTTRSQLPVFMQIAACPSQDFGWPLIPACIGMKNLMLAHSAVAGQRRFLQLNCDLGPMLK